MFAATAAHLRRRRLRLSDMAATSSGNRADAIALVQSLSPLDLPVIWRGPLLDDEATWFIAAVARGVIEFGVSRRLRAKEEMGRSRSRPFHDPDGSSPAPNSYPASGTAWLSREYVPYIAAHGRAILELRFASAPRSFCRYRTYRRDLVHRREGPRV
jgi:hypothetical protein